MDFETIRRTAIGVGSVILVIFLLPDLVPLFSAFSQSIGGAPGFFVGIMMPFVLLVVLYSVFKSPRQERGMR